MNTFKIKTGLYRTGFTLVEIMIVVAIIGLLAAIAIPNFLRARSTSQANACINNLHQISGAIQQWALETRRPYNAPVGIPQLTPYIKLNSSNSLPACPAGGSYSVTTVNAQPVCSIGNNATPGHVLP